MVACADDPSPGAETAPPAQPAAVAAPSPALSPTSSVAPPATATPPPSPTATQVPETPAVVNADPTSTPLITGPIRPIATLKPESSPIPTPIAGLLRLQDDLDDPLGYCIDVRGFGSGIRLDADLQAHSCKRNSPDDQSFAINGPDVPGPILLVHYGLCLTVPDPAEGGSIFLGPCDDTSTAGEFYSLYDGLLRLGPQFNAPPSNLCIGVADGPGEPAGGRNHLRRDLLLLDCEATDPSRITWELEFVKN